MAVRVRSHEGDHTWALASSSGVCKECLNKTGRALPLKMKWVCTVPGCKGKKTSKHTHIF